MGSQHDYVLFVTTKSRGDEASINAQRLVHRGDTQLAVSQLPARLAPDELRWLTTVPTVLETRTKTIYQGPIAFAFLRDRWLYVEKAVRPDPGAHQEGYDVGEEEEEEVDPSRRTDLTNLLPGGISEQHLQEFARSQQIVDPPLKKQRSRGEEQDQE